MPLQQIFSPNNPSHRTGRKGRNNNNNTSNQLDKVYTQDEKETGGEHGAGLLPRSSSLASTCSNNNAEICRICHSEADADTLLISPCHCIGSLRFVHQKCLQRWIKSSQAKTCELCRYEFQMQSKTKPLNKWEKLDMSPVERRKILCSVMFHVIAITCVIWSLYVLIDRTTEEIAKGELEWPFWTKLIVVAIGFTGGVVFMYVQCKMYIQLCRRWKTYNRVIFIQACQLESHSPPATPPPPPRNNPCIFLPSSPPPPSLIIHADLAEGFSDSQGILAASRADGHPQGSANSVENDGGAVTIDMEYSSTLYSSSSAREQQRSSNANIALVEPKCAETA